MTESRGYLEDLALAKEAAKPKPKPKPKKAAKKESK